MADILIDLVGLEFLQDWNSCTTAHHFPSVLPAISTRKLSSSRPYCRPSPP
jgi:hypothetical protein